MFGSLVSSGVYPLCFAEGSWTQSGDGLCPSNFEKTSLFQLSFRQGKSTSLNLISTISFLHYSLTLLFFNNKPDQSSGHPYVRDHRLQTVCRVLQQRDQWENVPGLYVRGGGTHSQHRRVLLGWHPALSTDGKQQLAIFFVPLSLQVKGWCDSFCVSNRETNRLPMNLTFQRRCTM